MPNIVTMNFEKALISAVNHEFPESRALRCYFPFKQASHRKLKKYRLLTIIKIVQINQAIGYIQSLATAKDTINQFWAYFNLTWMVSLWNISAGIEQAMP
ncbi:hypothetical protein HZS_4094 [Henneguya salminicola]|nr:hypothetical protein HZS_4094 [Henneguya salminicola]